MGRVKMQIKPIRDTTTRQVTVCKRRRGLRKKARELSILCDAPAPAVIVFSNTGRIYDFASPKQMKSLSSTRREFEVLSKELSLQYELALFPMELEAGEQNQLEMQNGDCVMQQGFVEMLMDKKAPSIPSPQLNFVSSFKLEELNLLSYTSFHPRLAS